MSIKTKFYFILAGFALAIILSTVSSYLILNSISDKYNSTLETVKVNVVYYNKIVMSKDLIADILPPPMYIVESFLICNQIYSEKDPIKRDELIAKSISLKNDYQVREKIWKSDLPEGDMKNGLLIGSKNAAYKFFDLKDKQFLPAIKSGDYTKANILLTNDLNEIFNEHKMYIEKVVELASQAAVQIESESNTYQATASQEIKDLISFDTILLFTINVIILIILSGITLFIILKFIKNLQIATDRLLKLSDGVI